MSTRVCKKCGIEKSMEQFPWRTSSSTVRRRYICRKCQNVELTIARNAPENIEASRKKGRTSMRKLRSDPKKLERQRVIEAGRRAASPRYALNLAVHNARNSGRRSKKRANFPIFNITTDYLMALWAEQKGLCALSGILMTWSNKRIHSTSLSLDRINSERGYEIGNVRLVCYALNAFRQNMTDTEMFIMAETMLAHQDLPKLHLVINNDPPPNPGLLSSLG